MGSPERHEKALPTDVAEMRKLYKVLLRAGFPGQTEESYEASAQIIFDREKWGEKTLEERQRYVVKLEEGVAIMRAVFDIPDPFAKGLEAEGEARSPKP